MKNLIVICLMAFLSQAAFAQQTSAIPAPAAEKKACCAAGSKKAGKSCCAPGTAKTGTSSAAIGMAEDNAAPTAATTDQTAGMAHKSAVTAVSTQTAQFQVWGNCGMCKKTIEKAAKGVAGVATAEWNVDTHQFSATFDPAKTSIDKVHQAIAKAGYDTDTVRGDDTAYNDLPGCCQYERQK